MGYFDQLFSKGKDPRDHTKPYDILTAMIPLVGPVAAIEMAKRRAKKAAPKLDSMFSEADPQGDPLSERVLGRMLARSGGNTSTPGFMAQTMLGQEAAVQPRMSNAYDAAARRLTAAGQGKAGSTLGAFGKKAYGVPQTATETDSNMENFTKDGKTVAVSDPAAKAKLASEGWVKSGVKAPDEDWTPVTGAEIGFKGPGKDDDFFVRYGSDGKILEAKNAAGQKVNVSVGGTKVNTPADISQAMVDFGNSYKGTTDFIRTTDRLDNILAANPTGGVSGWSGVITSVVGRVSNLTDFLAGLGKEEADIVNKYTPGLLANSSKLFPTAAQAEGEALTIQLAYSLARLNNMGTAGGGRGITDADMQFALKQLGSMAKPADMRRVLASLREQALDRFETDYEVAEVTLNANGKQVPPAFRAIKEKLSSRRAKKEARTFNLGPGDTLPADLQVGDVVDGMRYLGGPHDSQASWEPER